MRKILKLNIFHLVEKIVRFLVDCGPQIRIALFTNIMSSFPFNFSFSNLAYNTLVRKIDSDRTGANIEKMTTNMKNYYIINCFTR